MPLLLHCALASCGAVYCNRSCLCVGGCVCLCVCGSVTTITRNYEHRFSPTGFVGKGSDHLQLIKFSIEEPLGHMTCFDILGPPLYLCYWWSYEWAIHIFNFTHDLPYPYVLFAASLNSLKDRRGRLSRSFFKPILSIFLSPAPPSTSLCIGQVLHSSSKEEPLVIAGARLLQRLDALPVTHPTVLI